MLAVWQQSAVWTSCSTSCFAGVGLHCIGPVWKWSDSAPLLSALVLFFSTTRPLLFYFIINIIYYLYLQLENENLVYFCGDLNKHAVALYEWMGCWRFALVTRSVCRSFDQMSVQTEDFTMSDGWSTLPSECTSVISLNLTSSESLSPTRSHRKVSHVRPDTVLLRPQASKPSDAPWLDFIIRLIHW